MVHASFDLLLCAFGAKCALRQDPSSCLFELHGSGLTFPSFKKVYFHFRLSFTSRGTPLFSISFCGAITTGSKSMTGSVFPDSELSQCQQGLDSVCDVSHLCFKLLNRNPQKGRLDTIRGPFSE